MKCVGAEDGQKPCQRCKRTNVEYVGNNVIPPDGRYTLQLSRCIFEKHRRGRKPGSKYDFNVDVFYPSNTSCPRLSEASKMLRRLEKGLNTAKLKQANETSLSSVFPAVDSQSPQVETQFGTMIRPMDQHSTSGNGSSLLVRPQLTSSFCARGV